MTRPSFHPERLLDKIAEVGQLAKVIAAMPDGEMKAICITRWAIVTDEVAALTHLAAEMLSEDDLMDLQDLINAEDERCWDRYHTSPRLFKQLAGKELWEL